MSNQDYKKYFMATVEREIYQMAGYKFDINSKIELANITSGQTSSFIRQITQLVNEYQFLTYTLVWRDSPEPELEV